MINRLRRLLSHVEGHENILQSPPPAETASFELRFEDLIVGYLELSEGTWSFHYSDDFKAQGDLKPLVDFPTVDRVYRSENLWPFFAMRIPSLEQPSVQRVIQKEQMDRNNTAQLLKRFGSKTIANPFRLEAA